MIPAFSGYALFDDNLRDLASDDHFHSLAPFCGLTPHLPYCQLDLFPLCSLLAYLCGVRCPS